MYFDLFQPNVGLGGAAFSHEGPPRTPEAIVLRGGALPCSSKGPAPPCSLLATRAPAPGWRRVTAADQAGSQREPLPEPRGSRLRGRRATRGDPSAPGCRDRPRDPERFRRSAPPSAGPREADTRLGEEDAPHGRCSWCSGTARASAPKGGTTGRGQRPRGPGGRARSDTRPSSDRGPPQCTRATPGAPGLSGAPAGRAETVPPSRGCSEGEIRGHTHVTHTR